MMSIVSRLALTAALLGSLVAPVVAVSYLHTPEGVEYLEQPSIAAWVGPATVLLRPLLDGLGVDRVYLVGTQAMAVLWLATVAAALAVARRRRPAGLERVWWWIALLGYAWFTAGLLGFGLLAGLLPPTDAVMDGIFLAGMLPGLLVSLIGSTLLGVGMLRRRDPDRGAAWLLALAVPLWLFANLVLGHNSIGLLPLMWAWALASRSAVRRPRSGPVPVTRPGSRSGRRWAARWG